MAKRNQGTPGNPRARLTGAAYLVYFMTAIAASLISSSGLRAMGDFLNVVSYALYAVLTLLLFNLLRPVDRRLSLIAAVVSFLGCVAGALSVLHPLLHQINPLWFFGVYCVLIGYLILESTFMPRILGATMALAGIGWLVFLIPSVAQHLGPAVEFFGIVAEALLMLWLLAKGVDVPRWHRQVRAADASA